jgi:4-hydroxy-tetrahydrodipicolinate synthase
MRLWDLCASQQWSEAVALYRTMLPLLRFDSDPVFVQAIKVAQAEAGRRAGGVRLPRLPLPAELEATVRALSRTLAETAG